MESMGGKAEFDQLVKGYLQQFSKQYSSHIQKATDKDYMRKWLREFLLKHNEQHPFNTLFFHALHCVYEHFFKLDESRSLEYTLHHLPLIVDSSHDALEKGMLYMTGNIGSDQLPEHYLILMQEDQCPLSQIIS